MPSPAEMGNALKAVISRRGGVTKWAAMSSLSTRNESCTRRGWAAELLVASELADRGYDVERQRRAKAPFDLLVDGRIRINVKSATYHEYGVSKGYFFGIGDTWKRCDVFAFVAMHRDGSRTTYWAMADEVKQQTLTLTPSHWVNSRSGAHGIGETVSRLLKIKDLHR